MIHSETVGIGTKRANVREYTYPKQVGPMGALTPNIGPGRSDKEIDVGTSLPPLPTVPQEPPAIHAVWASRVDGCPECVLNVEPPRWTESTRDGFRTHHHCSDCGHRWFTDWKD